MTKQINNLENQLVQLGCNIDTLYQLFTNSNGIEEYEAKLNAAILRIRG